MEPDKEKAIAFIELYREAQPAMPEIADKAIRDTVYDCIAAIITDLNVYHKMIEDL